MSPPHLAVICDYPEEGWPSMDVYAEMLLKNLKNEHGYQVRAQSVCPTFRCLFGRIPVLGRRRAAFNADRWFNRCWNYPRFLRRQVKTFDLFHVCDHSYAHLVHVLPAERTGVFCHDLDAFRCLLEPQRERRPYWFRRMSRHILRGLQKAAVVFHSTAEVRKQIEKHGVLDPSRLVQAPYGLASEFTPEPVDPEPARNFVPGLTGAPFLLHVGSCIPRKRIDVLLAVFAGARTRLPELRLVQIGGQWTPEQQQQIDRLGIASHVVQLRGLTRGVLASLYRQAAPVLLPSEAEGFGLPMIEALACGAVVVASDIPVLREVGGDACVFCSLAEVPAWVEAVTRILVDPGTAPARSLRLAHARRFSWAAHAHTIVEAYRKLPLCLAPRP